MNTDTATNCNSEPNKPGLRPWKKGQSGNPHGRRPKGLATVEKLRTALLDDLPAILAVIVKNAKGGDIAAARTILERILPPLKAVEVPAYFGSLTGTLSEQGAQIMQAMAAGALAPGQAAQLLAALAAQAKIVEVDHLARRLAALETRLGTGNGKY
jgi:hypothetical protein